MPNHVMLLAPSANRVYAAEAATLAAGELVLTAPFVRAAEPTQLAGVDYLGFDADELTDEQLAVVSRQSAALALFHVEGELLRPVQLPSTLTLPDDLVTIPKYPGKTNEQFTQLLLNVTLASIDTEVNRHAASTKALDVLDPLAGRGTTMMVAWLLGHNGFGVEGDTKAVEQMAAYLKTWLRRKRLKHTAEMTPVRREGKAIGKRFDAELKDEKLQLTMFTGDTRQSQYLYGKKKFDAIVTDAPYGVVHGAHQVTDVRGHAGKRDRSPAGLIGEALPVWAEQLRPGGALGISWNTYGLSREDLASLMAANGLAPQQGEQWLGFAHRVDSSINRDLMVGVKQAAE